jgi:hypothetical protein
MVNHMPVGALQQHVVHVRQTIIRHDDAHLAALCPPAPGTFEDRQIADVLEHREPTYRSYTAQSPGRSEPKLSRRQCSLYTLTDSQPVSVAEPARNRKGFLGLDRRAAMQQHGLDLPTNFECGSHDRWP